MTIKSITEYSQEFKNIENFSKTLWLDQKTNQTALDESKEKMVILDFFPYPSGIGLHIGHPLGYIATDIYARFWKLSGKNVLFAMGYDAFGLPAEQFAIEHGVHPEITTKKNIDNIAKQLDALGLSHDPTRTFSTTDKDYYKWTQWIFLQLFNSYFDETQQKAMPITNLEQKLRANGLNEDEIYDELKKKRLAYLDMVEVNWCPKLGTVLADEEVINGLSERGNHPVFRKPLEQWVMRITEYGPRLVENLEPLNWPVSVKEMQRNWVGISTGHEVEFAINDHGLESIKVFTTRLDTIEGVCFCAIAVDHEFADILCVDENSKNAVSDYRKKQEEQAGKQYQKEEDFAVFTGSYAINPITNERVPIYVASYVLAYGTGAVMGVPAHDERDMKLAKRENLAIKVVIKPNDAFLNEHGISFQEYIANAKDYPAFTAKNETYDDQIQKFEKNSAVTKKTNMKLRDWIFSRQRYWGEPFPIVLDEQNRPYALELDRLPLELPDLDDFQPEMGTLEVTKPLDKAKNKDGSLWKDIAFIKLDLNTARIVDAEIGKQIIVDGKEYEVHKGKRETNTMPNWAGSCWYFLRYMDPKNDEAFVGSNEEKYWSLGKNRDDEVIPGRKKFGAIDLYLGGAEHAVLHLLYARFWYMVLHDLGYVSCAEPFDRLFNQGMLLGAAYSTADGKYIAPTDVEHKNGKCYEKETGLELIESIGKIGKRYKNGVPPEEVCNLYSVDALRLYMMYLGPLEQSKPWDYRAIKGMSRFLEKVCKLKISQNPSDAKMKFKFNETVKKVQEDFKALKFNTAIAALIIFINFVEDNGGEVDIHLYKKILIVLSPLAVHTCEYLFNKNVLDNKSPCSIFTQEWPEVEEIEMVVDKINVVVTINGRKKAVVEFAPDVSAGELDAYIAEFAAENAVVVKKAVVIKDANNRPKLINIVE